MLSVNPLEAIPLEAEAALARKPEDRCVQQSAEACGDLVPIDLPTVNAQLSHTKPSDQAGPVGTNLRMPNITLYQHTAV